MDQLNAFIEKTKSDDGLKAKVEALGQKGAGIDDYIALAAEYGFVITAEEFNEVSKHGELSEDDLENVAGGMSNSGKCYFTPTGKTINDGWGYRAECNSYCGYIKEFMCECHGSAGSTICIDRWHKLEDDDYLRHKTSVNHWQKKPPSYNT